MAQTTSKKKINLLPSEYREPKKYKKITNVSFGILGVYLLVMFSMFGYFLLLSYQASVLKQENSKLTQDVQSQKEKEGLLVTLKSKVNSAKSIFSLSSPSASDLVNSIVALLPESITLVSANADRDGKVLLIITSKDSSGISQIISVLEQKKFKGVTLNSLALNVDFYTMALDIRP